MNLSYLVSQGDDRASGAVAGSDHYWLHLVVDLEVRSRVGDGGMVAGSGGRAVHPGSPSSACVAQVRSLWHNADELATQWLRKPLEMRVQSPNHPELVTARCDPECVCGSSGRTIGAKRRDRSHQQKEIDQTSAQPTRHRPQDRERRLWRVYKLAFPFQLPSLEKACNAIISSRSRAQNVRILVFAPGFSLSGPPVPNGKRHSNTLIPTFETDPPSLESISNILMEALQLLPNVHELVIPEIRHYYPDRNFASHQLQWLNYVYDILEQWCTTSKPQITGIYSSTTQAFTKPIIEAVSSSLERLVLPNKDEKPLGGMWAASRGSTQPFRSKLPHLTHLLYPVYSSQSFTQGAEIQNIGLACYPHAPSKYHKELRPPRATLVFHKGEPNAQRPWVTYQAGPLVQEHIGHLEMLLLALKKLESPTYSSYYASEEDQHPPFLHLSCYLERRSILIREGIAEGELGASRVDFVTALVVGLQQWLNYPSTPQVFEHIVLSSWFSDTTASHSAISTPLPSDAVPRNIVKYQATLSRDSTLVSTARNSWKWSGEMKIEECPPRWGLDAATWDRLCGFGNVLPPTVPSTVTTSVNEDKGDRHRLPSSPLRRLPAELIDLLAIEDVYSLSTVNSTFNAFANRKSWKVYKLAFPFQLSSLKAACIPIVSNPIRARNIRVLVLAPGFSLAKQSVSDGKTHPTTLLPIYETSHASFETISELLAEALHVLSNVRELVVPEIRHYWPDRRFTSHQVQWLAHVYDTVSNWCQTSSPRLTGLYASVPQVFMAPILEATSKSLERITLLNGAPRPPSDILATFIKSPEPLLWKVPHLTHLLSPSLLSQHPIVHFGIQNSGLVLISRALSEHHKELWPPKHVLMIFRGDLTAQQHMVEYRLEAPIGEPGIVTVLEPILNMISSPSLVTPKASHESSEEDTCSSLSLLHLQYYLERASALIGRDDDGAVALVSRAQLIKQMVGKLCELLEDHNPNAHLKNVFVSFWLSDTTSHVAKMIPRFQFCVDGVLHNVVRHQVVLTRDSSPSMTLPSTPTPTDGWRWSGEMETEKCHPRWGLDAAIWDRLFALLAQDDVRSLSVVNSAFNVFANKITWRVYKLAFPFHLASLKTACHPIISNPSRARNIRVLVFAPGFSLFKQPSQNGKNYPSALMPTFEMSRASFPSVSKLLMPALQLLPNVRELVIPEVRFYYPDRKFTSHQLQWLKHVQDVVEEWCETSSLPLTGLYSSTTLAFVTPILKKALQTLQRITLLNDDEKIPHEKPEVSGDSIKSLLSKMPNITHLLFPAYELQSLAPTIDIQNHGWALYPRPFSDHHKGLRPPGATVAFCKEESNDQRVRVVCKAEVTLGDLTSCLQWLVVGLALANPVNFGHHPPDEVEHPFSLHLECYLGRCGVLDGQRDGEGGTDFALLNRAEFMMDITLTLQDTMYDLNLSPSLERVVVSLWFSDANLSRKVSLPNDAVPSGVVSYQATLVRRSSTSPLGTGSSWSWSGEIEIKGCAPRWGLDAAMWDRLCGFGNAPAPSSHIPATAAMVATEGEASGSGS
ncbi:hypothetical protein DL93DRAFT_2160099 [Clavulina sp. PMI_390]|nr:hypothetical protein DL93DRAFT_2160099 [Clavulina sp. PMI_390]